MKYVRTFARGAAEASGWVRRVGVRAVEGRTLRRAAGNLSALQGKNV